MYSHTISARSNPRSLRSSGSWQRWRRTASTCERSTERRQGLWLRTRRSCSTSARTETTRKSSPKSLISLFLLRSVSKYYYVLRSWCIESSLCQSVLSLLSTLYKIRTIHSNYQTFVKQNHCTNWTRSIGPPTSLSFTINKLGGIVLYTF